MTTLDNPGDLDAIRAMVLAHQGREHSPATTVVLVRLLLEGIVQRSEAAQPKDEMTDTGETT